MSSPFTQQVVKAMRSLYPESLADKSFDNTGLLLEAPYRPNHLNNSILLTTDLTKAVADEAIRRKDSIIITYHPIIFRPLKALTLQNSQQSTLLRLAQEGISVYSPHTAVDAAPEGVNDWLADTLTRDIDPMTRRASQVRSVIHPVKEIPEGFEGAGYGRIVRFEQPRMLGDIAQCIRRGLGELSGLSIAVPQTVPVGQKNQIQISSVGLCAGSGGSMLGGLDVDLLFTGELSHHEALAAIEQGKCVITAFHSNTERLFLRNVLQEQLAQEIWTEFHKLSATLASVEGLSQKPEIAISEADRDPFESISEEMVDGGQW